LVIEGCKGRNLQWITKSIPKYYSYTFPGSGYGS